MFLKLIVVFPFLDLRYFLKSGGAPGRPGWPEQEFQTVGALGKVLRSVRCDPNGAEADVGAALLFRPEFSRPIRKGRRRALDCPKLDSGAEIGSRRIFADAHGHLQLEVVVDCSGADFNCASSALEEILSEDVEIPRASFEVLALAGKVFAGLYLKQSAKTAPTWPGVLPDKLLCEGLGSPFVVALLHEPSDEGTPFPGGSRLFSDVRHASVNAIGTDVSLWTLFASGGLPAGWVDHVRSFTRVLGALREVRILTTLNRQYAVAPFHLDNDKVNRALRRNDKYIRRKSYGGWPAQKVLAFEDRLTQGNALPTGVGGVPAHSSVWRSSHNGLVAIRQESTSLPVVPRRRGGMPKLDDADRKTIVHILKDAAVESGDPEGYFREMVSAAGFDRESQDHALNLLNGTAEDTAKGLVHWSVGMGTNPNDPTFTTLGSLLRPILPGLGLEFSIAVAAIVASYGLFRHPSHAEELRRAFQIPLEVSRTACQSSSDHGPDFVWQGRDSDYELQGFWPEPPLMEVGFLINAIEASRSVCLVEVADLARSGTGFLVSRDKVITNYHVVFPDGEPTDFSARARAVSLQFGVYSGESGMQKRTFALANDAPVLAKSPDSALDYVLLQAENKLAQADRVKPAEIQSGPLEIGASIQSLQHPAGGTMKLGTSVNSVKHVDPKRGITQYVTRAGQGSSGAPCFTEDWKVVALHHAERARWHGAIREGILMTNIIAEIEQHLD